MKHITHPWIFANNFEVVKMKHEIKLYIMNYQFQKKEVIGRLISNIRPCTSNFVLKEYFRSNSRFSAARISWETKPKTWPDKLLHKISSIESYRQSGAHKTQEGYSKASPHIVIHYPWRKKNLWIILHATIIGTFPPYVCINKKIKSTLSSDESSMPL